VLLVLVSDADFIPDVPAGTQKAAVYGVDIGKNLFHIVGVDATGMPIQRVSSAASCGS
jgi:hypothetical protein